MRSGCTRELAFLSENGVQLFDKFTARPPDTHFFIVKPRILSIENTNNRYNIKKTTTIQPRTMLYNCLSIQSETKAIRTDEMTSKIHKDGEKMEKKRNNIKHETKECFKEVRRGNVTEEGRRGGMMITVVRDTRTNG